MLVQGGRIESFPFDFVHVVGDDFGLWLQKHISYASRECAETLKGEDRSGANLHRHARVKRWIKTGVYRRSPLFLRAWVYWALRYFVRGGFLDGVEGFVYHLFSAFGTGRLWTHRFTLNARDRRGDWTTLLGL